MFKEIRLENWRNFKRVHAALTPRVFLVGPNAAGKSNFLDVFRFLQEIAKVGGSFQRAVSDRGGVSRLRSYAARRYPDVVVDVSLDIDGVSWRYAMAFSQDNQRRPILTSEEAWKENSMLLKRPDHEDEADPIRMSQTSLEQINVNKAFREVVDFLASSRYLHIVPQLVRDPDRSVGHQSDPYGGDFLEQLANTQPRVLDSRLRRIRDALKVAIPQLRDLQLKKDEKGTPHLLSLYEHWRPNAGWQNETQLSDGTLRLMGLLWALLDGAGPLLLEEPELSLHPEVVRYIPQMIARLNMRKPRQVFVSTHSPSLLEDEGIGPEEVLLLVPSKEGTEVQSGKDDAQIHALLEGGATMAEAVLPRTRPTEVQQLSLFGE